MPKTVSGKRCIKILTQNFGFFIASQRGSHVKLRRYVGTTTITTIVPRHSELAHGTLRGILELGNVPFTDFENYM